MNLSLVSYYDIVGGAARAAYRLHRSLLDSGLANSRMQVRQKKSDDWTVNASKTRGGQYLDMFRMPLGGLSNRLQRSENTNARSTNWIPSRWSDVLNKSEADVVNLHWVAGQAMSIEDIGKISKPVVWTLHDMWTFCGAEHVTNDDSDARWRNGYSKASRSINDSGFDLDRFVWLRKKKAWNRPCQIVTPSQWLAECVRESALFQDWPVTVIPNVLDTSVYKPLDRDFCRQALRLPSDKKIILFGAMGGGALKNKGYDLLLEALNKVKEEVNCENMICVIFGQSTPQFTPKLPLPTQWMGHIDDDVTLALLYNAADVMVVPSRQESFCQTATESQSCGCPVVAFNCTGLRDVVEHKKTGYLAVAYEPYDLANGIIWVLNNAESQENMSGLARQRAISLWSPQVVVPKYIDIYQKAIEK